MRKRYLCAAVGRFGFVVASIGVGTGPLAAQTDCLPPPLVSVLNEVTDTRRAVDVLTDHLNSAGEQPPQGQQQALEQVTSSLDDAATRTQIPQEQVVGLVCRLAAQEAPPGPAWRSCPPADLPARSWAASTPGADRTAARRPPRPPPAATGG